MASIIWKFPIDTIHGALKRGVFGAAQRKSPNAHGEQSNYSVFYGKRTTPYSADELANQSHFSAVSAAVKARKNDPTKKVTDKAAFAAQSAIPTFAQYLWQKAEADVAAAANNN